ncbi:putative methionyl-tRNA synthetase [Cantharellus anzutake]|uniref:putative methionyl-tRNA synthetase n=1 Tax=Cantharellus anzutake TaxID=1750568 RepID=UPI00190682E7|nr:putative methionyl-tRNA synthetase [Cantharellus anzutake]KAF8337627.1 putative methionyl-tRNA synthetase [Cantharellus anzutake]
MKPYYVSTPIFYVNAAPHIGHLYTSVIADVLVRYSRLRHPDRPVFLNTGTDEHGLKIQQAAEAAGENPMQFCDRISERFKELGRAASIGSSRFTRTTNIDHKMSAQYFWDLLERSGAVYKGQHSGWYSISDECFYTDAQVETITGQTNVKVATETGSIVEWTTEENYKFRLSLYREPLLEWLNGNKLSVYPPTRRDELILQLSNPENFKDISISRPRSRLQWGIPVPRDKQQVIYVWLEALVNYLTAVGHPWTDGRNDGKGWPTDVHVIGKDILRFHAVLLPAFLLAIGYELPSTILAHAHWTVNRQKMSKSRGNVTNPFSVLQLYGVDPIRYYMMSVAGNFHDDSNWSEEQIVNHYNRDLRGVLGNLVSRITSPGLTSLLNSLASEEGHSVTSYALLDKNLPEDAIIKRMLEEAPSKFEQHFSQFEIGKALEIPMGLVNEANRHFIHLRWWEHKDSPDIIRRSHFYTHEALRIASILLQPFMPTKSQEVLAALCAGCNQWRSTVLGASGVPAKSKHTAPYSTLFPPIKLN